MMTKTTLITLLTANEAYVTYTNLDGASGAILANHCLSATLASPANNVLYASNKWTSSSSSSNIITPAAAQAIVSPLSSSSSSSSNLSPPSATQQLNTQPTTTTTTPASASLQATASVESNYYRQAQSHTQFNSSQPQTLATSVDLNKTPENMDQNKQQQHHQSESGKEESSTTGVRPKRSSVKIMSPKSDSPPDESKENAPEMDVDSDDDDDDEDFNDDDEDDDSDFDEEEDEDEDEDEDEEEEEEDEEEEECEEEEEVGLPNHVGHKQGKEKDPLAQLISSTIGDILLDSTKNKKNEAQDVNVSPPPASTIIKETTTNTTTSDTKSKTTAQPSSKANDKSR